MLVREVIMDLPQMKRNAILQVAGQISSLEIELGTHVVFTAIALNGAELAARRESNNLYHRGCYWVEDLLFYLDRLNLPEESKKWV